MTADRDALMSRLPRGWLPDGSSLDEDDWRWRHRFVCVVLAGHLPVLALLGATSGLDLLALGGLALLLGGALRLPQRRPASLAAALGLIGCSALLLHVTAGAASAGDGSADAAGQALFHPFVVLAVLWLYQDWTAVALPVGLVVVDHALTGGDDGWALPVGQSAALGVQSAVLLVLWRAHAHGRDEQRRLEAELTDGRSSVQTRLAQADRIRADLIGTVSHEFRTPLTGIRAAALTLLKRGDRLDKQARDRLLLAMLEQQERLSRLLENMLLAAEATAVDPDATCEVYAVAAEVAMLAAAGRPGLRVSVAVEPGTVARIDRPALHQVLANLLDNALHHGSAEAVPVLTGGCDRAGVWVSVSNEGGTIDLTRAEQMFEPFVQGDSGVTRDREGIGVGLYVVRRLVEVYGGSVDVASDIGWTTVTVRLRPGDQATARLTVLTA